ncbi:PTS system glucitol/sorbitol-specific transporter subunit IIA [Klebsiella oxytoca]|nr:Uncharacterised protein [Klebsiella oxytoca]SBM18481.1 PTS system glucitol/sorbitol-specific transporter subunit IIA [Klebsiella oxytoca]
MMIYCARITAIGLFVADGLTDKMLITFDSNGPKDCLDYSLSLEPSFREESLMILPGDRLMLAGPQLSGDCRRQGCTAGAV